MNTVRVPTSFDAERGPVATYTRMIALAMLLSVAVFAGFFALGRSERPASTPREQLASSISTTSAGPAIPVQLASSPPIASPLTAAVVAPTHAQSAQTAPATSSLSQAALASAQPSSTSVAVATPAAPAYYARDVNARAGCRCARDPATDTCTAIAGSVLAHAKRLGGRHKI